MSEDAASRFGSVGAALARAARGDGVRAVLVCGTRSGDGATTLTLGAAAVLARVYGLRVLAVEGNARAPAFVAHLALDARSAVADWPLEVAALRDAVCTTDAGYDALALAPRGAVTLDSRALVETALVTLAPDYDLVLVDGPALLEGAGALSLSATLRHAVLVVRYARTRVELLDRARELLAAERVQLLGAVLNRHRRRIPHWAYRLLLQ